MLVADFKTLSFPNLLLCTAIQYRVCPVQVTQAKRKGRDETIEVDLKLTVCRDGFEARWSFTYVILIYISANSRTCSRQVSPVKRHSANVLPLAVDFAVVTAARNAQRVRRFPLDLRSSRANETNKVSLFHLVHQPTSLNFSVGTAECFLLEHQDQNT